MSDAWVDHDYPPRQRVPAKCEKCGGDKILRHVCDDAVAICDAIEEADDDDTMILPDDMGQKLAAMREVEATMLTFAEHMKYPQARPDRQGNHAVLMMNYLPDLPDTLAYHFTRLGWRWHPEKALIKQRKIEGGLFDDLVAYVELEQPDDPIVVQSNMQAAIDPNLWPVKPKVTVIDEERPPDYDQY